MYERQNSAVRSLPVPSTPDRRASSALADFIAQEINLFYSCIPIGFFESASKMQKISEFDDFRLWPKCLATFKLIPSSGVFHDEWEIRPPFGAFNVAVSALERRFTSVLDELSRLHQHRGSNGHVTHDAATRLIDAHGSLMYSMAEYFDDCAKIVRAFFPKAEEIKP